MKSTAPAAIRQAMVRKRQIQDGKHAVVCS